MKLALFIAFILITTSTTTDIWVTKIDVYDTADTTCASTITSYYYDLHETLTACET